MNPSPYFQVTPQTLSTHTTVTYYLQLAHCAFNIYLCTTTNIHAFSISAPKPPTSIGYHRAVENFSILRKSSGTQLQLHLSVDIYKWADFADTCFAHLCCKHFFICCGMWTLNENIFKNYFLFHFGSPRNV